MLKIGYTIDNTFDPDHEDFYMLCFHIHKWMIFICILGGLLVIESFVRSVIDKTLGSVNIIITVTDVIAYSCMIIGFIFWRKFYTLLNIYLFYMGVWIFFEFGFLGEVTVAAIIASNRKSNMVNGKEFER
ncbi:hypothetical protein FO519_010432 [Halicephalobus sp. NKZ332]|nr:hypothetical protein FO519_010432 [Halicephalobus sp. NKZ332]